MMGVEDQSEYEGGGVMPNTVFPHDGEITAAEQLRLMSLTGQTSDTRAQVDPYFWQGNVRPDLTQENQDARARKRKERQAARDAVRRYRESPL